MDGRSSGDAHDRVRAAAQGGLIADFSRPDDGDALADYDDDPAWEGRTLEGGRLAELVAGSSGDLHHRGVRIRRARVVGGLDLAESQLARLVTLEDCQFGDHRITLERARCRSVVLSGSRCGGLDVSGADLVGDLLLERGFSAFGEVRAAGAKVAGRLSCAGAGIINPDGHALVMDRAQVTGAVFLRDGFDVLGQTSLTGATVGGDLILARAKLDNPGGRALAAARITCAGGLFLWSGFRASGEVWLPGSKIGGSLTCDGAEIRNPGGRAVVADGCEVSGDVLLRYGFDASGEVRLLGASIGGDLNLAGARLTNPTRAALLVDGARIGGGVYLREGFEAAGQVRLPRADVAGDVIGERAEITDPPEGAERYALVATNATVSGNVLFRPGFRVVGGEVRLPGVDIGGQLVCAGAELLHPGGHALVVDGGRIEGGVYLRDGLRTVGTVRLVGASVAMLTDDRRSWPDRIDLRGCRYAQLYGPDRGWRARADWLRRQPKPSPQPYRQLAEVYRSTGEERDARKILMARHDVFIHPPAHWLPHLPGSRLRRVAQRTWRALLRYTIGHGYEPWRALYLALPLLMVMTWWYSQARADDMLAAPGDPHRSSAACTTDYPCVQPAVLALDTLLPIVDFGQAGTWVPDQSRHDDTWYRDGRALAAATWLTNALGWVLATLVAAGFTNIIRRE